MATINEHTRKMITTGIRTTTDEYREGWERIFGAKRRGAEALRPEHKVSDLIRRQESGEA